MSEPNTPASPDVRLSALRATIQGEVRIDEDITLRQLAVLLTVYLTDEPQTVRGLAKHLSVDKPPVTRALDRLGMLDLVQRRQDPLDRRSVLAVRTPKGAAMVERLKARMVAASELASAQP